MQRAPGNPGTLALPLGVATALEPVIGCLSGLPPSLTHAGKLLHEHGVVQFARGKELHLDYGYCLDDNARAFLVSVLSLRLAPDSEAAVAMGAASLDFMERCRRPDGRFHNLMGEDGAFTDEVGSQESLARTLWGCGVGARCAPVPQWRERSSALVRSTLQRVDDLCDLRPKAYGVLGLSALLSPDRASLVPPLAEISAGLESDAQTALKMLCASLQEHFERNAQEDWDWWEPILTWGNARLPEALLRGAAALADPSLEQSGIRALRFLASITHERDVFVPIGNKGWYERGGARAVYDQQPIEACCMVDAWLAASKLTGRTEYQSKALEAFCWFFGLNTEKIVMVEANGGCYDGLEHGKVNQNMGAESTLSYIHTHAALALALRQKA